jgi:hypothetical protein
VHAPPARRGAGAGQHHAKARTCCGPAPPAPRQRHFLITAKSPIATGARSAALATAITSCWPTCSASWAPGRRLLHLQHQIDGGRRARALQKAKTSTRQTVEVFAFHIQSDAAYASR